jgi:hypothetical protein
VIDYSLDYPGRVFQAGEVPVEPELFTEEEYCIDDAGYQSTQQMVDDMMYAGDILQRVLAERYPSTHYDYAEGDEAAEDDDVQMPPTRVRNLDPADMDRILASEEARVERLKADIQAERKRQANLAAVEAYKESLSPGPEELDAGDISEPAPPST